VAMVLVHMEKPHQLVQLYTSRDEPRTNWQPLVIVMATTKR